MRFFIDITYKGTNYHGWQIQPNVPSIQEEINKSLNLVLNQKVSVVGAGRTDTGVHARQMFAHFDFNKNIDFSNLLSKLNGCLPSDISINKIFEVKNNVHSRFDALSRTYKYFIHHQKDPFCTNSYFLAKKLDVKLMNMSCKYLLGEKDFTSFSKKNTQVHTNMCNVSYAKWEEKNNKLIFTIESNRFLHNMVRSIVGTLIKVGQLKIDYKSIYSILQKKDRSSAGFSVPAKGLFLTKIEYPKSIHHV